jgi:antitoxin MazE
MQVSKWGNSLAIRIPASVTEALQLKEGDDIEVVVADTRTFEIRRQPSRDEMLSQLKAYRGRLPADFVFDRDEANERGTEIF